MKKALIVFLSFLLILNFSACGGKEDVDVGKDNSGLDSPTTDFKTYIDFTSFENYASSVSVLGSDILLGKYNGERYDLKTIMKMKKVLRDTLPDYTYYPYFNGEKTELIMWKAQCRLNSESYISTEYSISVYSPNFFNYRTSNVWMMKYSVSLKGVDQSTPKIMHVTLEQAGPGCEYPLKALAWDSTVKEVTDPRNKRRYYTNALENDMANEKYLYVIEEGIPDLYCSFLLEDRVCLRIRIDRDESQLNDEMWNDWIENRMMDWLEKLSFERIDFEYDKYNEIVDRDETLEKINVTRPYKGKVVVTP